MTRSERRIYQLGVAVAGVILIAIICVLAEQCQSLENEAYGAEETTGEYFIDQTEKEPKKGLFDEDSAMPCVDGEAFRSWLETYEEEEHEPETTEEARRLTSRANHQDAGTVTEPEPVSEEAETEVENDLPVLYRIEGQTIDESLQIRLYSALQEAGIGYWFEIGLCQLWQESHGDPYAVNPQNLEDMGIYQYKVRFWNWEDGDIFDVDAQIKRYASDMAARLNAGLSVEETISRHKTSDYCTQVDWQYVAEVKQHLPYMERIQTQEVKEWEEEL